MGDCKCSEAREEIPVRESRSEMFEPLMAIYEETTGEVRTTPYAPPQAAASACPHGVCLDRVKPGEGGNYVLEPGTMVATESPVPSCLPFVRMCRDPKIFQVCLEEARAIGPIKDSATLYKLVRGKLAEEDQEVFYVVMLNTQALVLAIGPVHRGERDRVGVGVPDVIRLPIVAGASSFAVVHNHPSGHVKPSKADDDLTKAIAKAADIIGIQFIDHMVAGIDGFYSYSDHNLV